MSKSFAIPSSSHSSSSSAACDVVSSAAALDSQVDAVASKLLKTTIPNEIIILPYNCRIEFIKDECRGYVRDKTTDQGFFDLITIIFKAGTTTINASLEHCTDENFLLLLGEISRVFKKALDLKKLDEKEFERIMEPPKNPSGHIISTSLFECQFDSNSARFIEKSTQRELRYSMDELDQFFNSRTCPPEFSKKPLEFEYITATILLANELLNNESMPFSDSSKMFMRADYLIIIEGETTIIRLPDRADQSFPTVKSLEIMKRMIKILSPINFPRKDSHLDRDLAIFIDALDLHEQQTAKA